MWLNLLWMIGSLAISQNWGKKKVGAKCTSPWGFKWWMGILSQILVGIGSDTEYMYVYGGCLGGGPSLSFIFCAWWFSMYLLRASPTVLSIWLQTVKYIAKKSKCVSLAQEIGFSAPNSCSFHWLVKVAIQLCTSKNQCNKLNLSESQYL
jgi:hypothetical protein